MTKAAPVAPVAPVAPEAPAVARKPFAIKVGAPAYVAFNEAICHARNGYCFSDAPIEMTPGGFAFFEMILGNPDEYAINKAKESADLSRDAEERDRVKAIKEAARRLVEDEKRAALEKQVAAIKAEQARQIAALEKAMAQAIEAL